MAIVALTSPPRSPRPQPPGPELEARSAAALAAEAPAEGPLALSIAPGEDLAAVAPWLPRAQLVVLTFPAVADGRPFSQARRLREQLGYQGELRAAGAIIPDQAWFMVRCGFTSLDLPERFDPTLVEANLSRYPAPYQRLADGSPTAADLRHPPDPQLER